MIDRNKRMLWDSVNLRRPGRSSFDTVLYLYSNLGLLIAILAFGYLGLSFLKIELSSEQLMAAVAGGTGLVLAVFSRTVIKLREAKRFEEVKKLNDEAKTFEFLEAWLRFEQASNEPLNTKEKNLSRHSFHSTLSWLARECGVTEDELKSLQEALTIRNQIVHGRGAVPTEALDRATHLLITITDKIDRASEKFKT